MTSPVRTPPLQTGSLLAQRVGLHGLARSARLRMAETS
jgi:hypothetical protein